MSSISNGSVSITSVGSYVHGWGKGVVIMNRNKNRNKDMVYVDDGD